jgi:tellurite resistance protein
MVISIENAIRHVRLCAEIENFSDAQKSVVMRLLIGDDAVVANALDELRALRSFAQDHPAIAARIGRVENALNADRLLKSTMVTRLSGELDARNTEARERKYQTLKKPVVPWNKKTAARVPKVVKLFADA